MKYLKQFWTILKEYFLRKSDIKFPDEVIPNEPLARYLLSKNYFSCRNLRVKSGAFMPAPDLKLSVFRVAGLSEDAIWKTGEKKVAQKSQPPKTLHGRAEIITSKVQDIGLNIEPDNNPPRHANIIGWPEEKSERKLIAIELANNAELKLRF